MNPRPKSKGISYRGVEQICLPLAEVHTWSYVWQNAAESEICAAVLSPEEKERGTKYRDRDAGLRWMAARTFLRSILAAYTETPPRDIQLLVSDQGKPFLAGKNPLSLRFNITHSGEYAIVAISREHSVGVDIEKIKPNFDYESIMSISFSNNERKLFSGLAESERLNTFYRIWTLKEAVAKAIGTGLSFPFEDIETRWDESGPQLVSISGNRMTAAALRAEPLDLPSPYVGVVVSEAVPWTLQTFTLSKISTF